MNKIIPDYCSNAGASRGLAKRLTQYWNERGRLDVKFWVERDDKTFKRPLYVVRTNLTFYV